MKACELLHIAFTAAYDAAAKRSYENTVRSLKSTMSLELVETSRSAEGLEASMRVVESIVSDATIELQGWTVTESLRKSYLQPLHDHGDVLRAQLVSLESC